MRVLKFGGSSVGSPDKILDVKKIVEGQDEKVIVVVSAFKDITDQLIRLGNMAGSKDINYREQFKIIEKRHLTILDELLSGSEKVEVTVQVKDLLKELKDITDGVYLLNDLTPKTRDRIVSYGERLSAYIISRVINDCEFFDTRNLIVTDNNFGNARVDFDRTNKLIKEKLQGIKKKAIVPGFIASDSAGVTTTLGRGGSDYSAAIIAAALDVKRLEIWTDVDGFMTADPKKVPKAFAIESLSYAEAMELSHFGAEVIYTPTIQPVYKKNIEIAVKNTFNPSAQGTIISNKSVSTDGTLIKGVSSIDDITLVTIQGPGMVGVKGISMRLFGALATSNINIILITQASSEYSITFAINPDDTENAIVALEHEFEPEIKLRHEIRIVAERNLSIIAIVGERMKNTPGISANLFRSLGANGISAIATAQGSSELNISVVISKESLKKALNVIHEGFFLSHHKELHLFLVGIGTVGKILLEQIRQQQEKLLEEHRLKINVVGISNSRKMLFCPECFDLENYRKDLDSKGEPANMKTFIHRMKEMNLRNTVFIDCTANEKVAGTYKEILGSFISVVTANKIACSSEYKLYKELKSTAKDKNVKFMYETNVGAGLPVISTINDMVKSGDKILHMEAVLSGTLNFIFNELSEKVSLSKAIQMAKEKGFSEPDPRIDLSGVDVVRKLLILARESGFPLEQKDVEIKPFLPASCFDGTIDHFWEEVKKYDNEFENKRKQLAKENKRWRFVAKLDCGVASVSLETVDASHPAYPLEGSNNILLITTDRYHEQPMVIRGYGAGAEVTAAGIFADVIRIANV